MKSHGLQIAQSFVDDNRFNAIQDGGAYVWGILEMGIRTTCPFGTKAGEHTAQALCPIAGAKWLPIAGYALNEKFTRNVFGGQNRISHVGSSIL
jgi:hypothetical protein